jgi:hypothetical protein
MQAGDEMSSACTKLIIAEIHRAIAALGGL